MAQRRYDHEKWARQQVREKERHERAASVAEKAADREQKQAAIAASRQHAQQLTVAVDQAVERLTSILHHGLDRSPRLDLSTLLRWDQPPPLDLGAIELPAPPALWEDYTPPQPSVLGAMLGGRARHRLRVAEAAKEFDHAKRRYAEDEADRLRYVADATARHRMTTREHEAAKAAHNERIEEMRSGLAVRDRTSVEAYLELILVRTPLPAEVPHRAEVAYTPRGEQAVVRFELPSVEIIPATVSYSYIGTTGEVRAKKRAATGIKQLYLSVVSQIALLYMRDLLDADSALENVELSGHVHAVNPRPPETTRPAKGRRREPACGHTATPVIKRGLSSRRSNGILSGFQRRSRLAGDDRAAAAGPGRSPGSRAPSPCRRQEGPPPTAGRHPRTRRRA